MYVVAPPSESHYIYYIFFLFFSSLSSRSIESPWSLPVCNIIYIYKEKVNPRERRARKRKRDWLRRKKEEKKKIPRERKEGGERVRARSGTYI